MTRDDLVSYITTKAQMVESDDVAACQSFVSKRYELIYNGYLWKDSLTMVDIAIDPVNNPDNAVGIVLLPAQIDRVVAIRTATQAMRIHALEEYYRVDWNRFADISDVNGLMEFSILNPIWMTCRPNPTAAVLQSNVPAYNFNIIVATIPGVTKYVGPTSSVTYTVPNGTYLLINGVNEWGLVNTGGVVPVAQNPPMPPVGSGSTVVVSNGSLTIYGAQGTAAGSAFTGKLYLISLSGTQTVGNGASVTLASDNSDDNSGGKTPQQIKVIWRDTQNRYVTTANMPLTLTPADGIGFIEIESVFKPVTLGNVNATLTNPVSSYNFTSVIGSLLPTLTRSPNLQRVRLFSAPNQTLTLSVLGKKPFVPLDFGSEQPLIRNLDNCLIAFGLADMLQRGRQYGKAQSQMQEATVLLSELAKLETLQAANNQRFIPDGGYGDPFFSPSSNRGLWT